MSDRDISGHTKVGRVQDLIGGGIGQDSLGVNTSLVGKGTESGDVVVKGNGDFDSLGNQVFDFSEHGKVVLGLDVLGVGDHHSGNQSSQGRNSVSLTDTQDRGVNVSRTGLEGSVSVGNGTSSVVVEVALNVTADDSSQSPDEVIDLPRVGTSDCVSDTDSVQTDLVDGPVDAQEINELGSEGVFGRESNLDALGLDVFDNLDGLLGDPGHVLAVRVFTKERGSSNDNINTVDTGLNGQTGIIHVASNVSENPGNEKRVSTQATFYSKMTTHLDRFNPMEQIVLQSLKDSGEAAGEVNSMYSTPKSSRLFDRVATMSAESS